MDYFSWLAVSPERTIVIDSGFSEPVGKRRGRTFLRCPVDSLKLLDIDPATVQDVILTHLHYDHVGNFHKFPVANFHVQERELTYATGRYMRHTFLSAAYELSEVLGVVGLNYGRRVFLHDGDVDFAPGIKLHLVGGHTGGLQIVTINTKRGTVVLASDATHYYENMEKARPFTTVFHVGDMLEGFEKLQRLAARPDLIVPGHDPMVMQRYPAPTKELEGIIVRLDVSPKS